MMDLESYISRYSGETRLQRLLLVAQTTSDETVADQAFDLAEQQIKADGNVTRYKEIFGYSEQQHSASEEGAPAVGVSQEQLQDTIMAPMAATIRRPSKPFDQEWAMVAEAANRNDRHVLQGRLSTAQSHLHKEAIRTAYIALAQHCIKTGELRDALGSLLRAVDYSTSRSQTAHISVLILEVCFGLKQYSNVREYVHKVEHTLGATASRGASPSNAGGAGLQEVSIKLKIASGLDRLAQHDYEAAASIFTQLTKTNSGVKLEWPGVACAEDIALYASLLSVATQSRSSILALSEHPEALELVPTMKDLLAQWSRANYGSCMQVFSDSGSSNLVPLGDLYLSGSNWKDLSQTIREKCLLEYLKPYQCVRLDSMMQFFPSIINLEDTLVDLMGRGLIKNAKIDARARVLFKSQSKPAINLAFMERRVLDDTHAMLIRLACLEHDLSVEDTKPRGRSAALTAAAAHFDDEDDDEEGDTPMLDADAHNMAANPEDQY